MRFMALVGGFFVVLLGGVWPSVGVFCALVISGDFGVPPDRCEGGFALG